MKPDPSEELPVTEPLNDESVSKYLLDNPEFFNRKGEILLELDIPHESGAAISLLERQVAIFRKKNRDLQSNINDFIFNAEENDALFEKTRTIILALLKTKSLSALSEIIEDTLRVEFAAHASRLFFITDDENTFDGESIRTLAIKPAQKSLGKLVDKKRTFCCELDKDQAQLLFPDTKKVIVSTAVIPVHLSESLREEKGIGMPILVIGSEKNDHFNSRLDTLFLDFIGEILASHVTRLIG